MFSRFTRLFVALVLWLSAAAWAEVPVPPLKSRVTDLTATLSASQRSALESELQAFEARTGGQIAILLVPSTRPEAIEQYSIRVVEAWKLGRKGKDDGLLLLVAKNDHRMRIEVGYGLEGVIPDAIAKRVIDESIGPLFKQGDFAGGLTAGVKRLAGLIEGRTMASTAPQAPANGGLSGVLAIEKNVAAVIEDRSFSEQLINNISAVPIWLLVALAVAGTALRWLFGPLFGGVAMGGLVGGGAWFVTGTLGAAVLAGILGFVFVLVGISNWIAMGVSGSSGGRSSGGGFSGGGGSFGGGGASGNW
jgi:uncharacterized protein